MQVEKQDEDHLSQNLTSKRSGIKFIIQCNNTNASNHLHYNRMMNSSERFLRTHHQSSHVLAVIWKSTDTVKTKDENTNDVGPSCTNDTNVIFSDYSSVDPYSIPRSDCSSDITTNLLNFSHLLTFHTFS